MRSNDLGDNDQDQASGNVAQRNMLEVEIEEAKKGLTEVKTVRVQI